MSRPMSRRKAKKPQKERHRIPYDVWANSHLSVAKYYGGCKLNGKTYELDYDNCKTVGEGSDMKYFPNLVEVP